MTVPHGWTICGVLRSIYAMSYVILHLGIVKPMNLINFGSKFKFEINLCSVTGDKVSTAFNLPVVTSSKVNI